jgi:hypothetical protein
MAGHIQDRWFKTETGADGKTVRVKTDRHGTGMRYRARYVGPDGTEKSKSFPDGQKRIAEKWLSGIEADMSRGQYIDPRAGRLTVRQHAERWLASLTMDPGTFVSTEQRIRLHVLPHLGRRSLDSLRPIHIREWLRKLKEAGRENGMHALRHFYASVLLDAGESVKALSEYLGHHDPGFTLRTYTHLMPSSEKRTPEAVNRAFEGGPDADDGPTTAQAA